MTVSRQFSSDRFAAGLLAALLTSGALALLVAGPLPQLIYPSDVAAYLDACQRIAVGQWLGRDFSSPIGPAALLPTALAMRCGQISVSALVTGTMLAWIGYGLLAWFTVRPRMPAWLAVGFALFVAGTAAAPYTLDFGSWRILSYGMLYNRLAWAALAISAAGVLLPRHDGTCSSILPAGLGAGALWLWALKPNYLIILAPLMLYSWLADPARIKWIGRAATGALLALLAVWLCVPFTPIGYVNTHLGMAHEAPPDLMRYTFLRSLQENAWIVLVLVVIWALALRAMAGASRLRLLLAVAAVIGATFVANLANCQFSEIPLWGALGWIAAATPGERSRVALAAGLITGLAFTWQPLASVGYGLAWKKFRAPGTPPALAITSEAWTGMPMRPMPGEAIGPGENLEHAGNLAAWLNDGLALLARHRPASGTVLSLDWVNPFPFATGTPPPPGDEIAWHVGRTVGPSHHPDIARLLATAAVVMEPRRSLQPASLAFKRDLFAPLLATSFVVVEETDHWRLWLRRAPASPPTRS